MQEEIMGMNDHDLELVIIDTIRRLREISYARGYKDGFNDGKEAEHQKQLMLDVNNTKKI